MPHRVSWPTLAFGLLLIPACSGDGVLPPDGDTQTVLLRYDGNQDSSPNLAGNTTYEAAARFTPVETAGMTGSELTEVRFFIMDVPDACRVKIYGEGTPTTPGPALYAADVTASVVGSSWNTHVLTSPVTVPAGDLWISIEFTDAVMQPTIGCDPGPAVPDGNWLYSSSTGSWTPFFVSVNWNVRGVVEIPI